uniref:Uncharacterized protein n=1 Tax=Anguilla anguilla TaxID=7936 RepID=A0A0E9UY94_ANGAN
MFHCCIKSHWRANRFIVPVHATYRCVLDALS